jgi:thioredoxin 1
VTDAEIVEIIEVLNTGNNTNVLCDALDVPSDSFLEYENGETSSATENKHGAQVIDVLARAENADLAAVLKSPGLVMLDFFTPDCVPCRKLEAMIKVLAQEFGGLLKVRRVDAATRQEVAQSLDVRSVPALLLFRSGQLVARRLGFATVSQLRDWVNTHLA